MTNSTWTPRRVINTQHGLNLLEILVVLAIIGAVMGILFGPAIWRAMTTSDIRTSEMQVQAYANTAYVQWRMKTGEICPESLEDLRSFANKEPKDAWGQPLQMTCAPEVLPEDVPFGVYSLGPDKKDQTPDDIRSWDKKVKERQ